MSTKAIAIIPARGGSKGIPRKNVRLLAGKPLIAYTIEAVLKSKYIKQVLVSTDDSEIMDVSKEYGADVIKRPNEFAQDNSPTIDTVLHVLESLETEEESIDIVVLLQPTSPLRNTEDINCSMELFIKNEPESLISVCEAEHPPFWYFSVENSYLKPLFGVEYLNTRRQDLPKTFMPNGAVYISRPEHLIKYRSFYCQKVIPYLMPMQRSIDIDTEIDFNLATMMLNTVYSSDD